MSFAEATIGPEGGSMSINSCQVRIPEGALCGQKQFFLTTSLIETYENEYAPISAVLECEPATNFQTPVQISLPIWCDGADDKIVAQVLCVSSDSHKREVIKTINLQNTENVIMFDSQHFSSFYLRIKKALFRKLKFKAIINIWKSPERNYTFVLSAKDKTIEHRWREELGNKGYGPTRAVFNTIVLKHKDELHITMASQHCQFQPTEYWRLVPDFFHNQIYYKTFVLDNEEVSRQGNTETTMTCTICQPKRLLEQVTWNETLNTIPGNGK